MTNKNWGIVNILRSKGRRIAAAAALTTAALTFGSGPAWAGTDVVVTTNDVRGEEWAVGNFYHNGDHWKVCDKRADGLRASLWIYWSDSTGNHFRKTSDTNGANNSCATGTADIPENLRVSVRICLQDGANGTEKYCSVAYGKS